MTYPALILACIFLATYETFAQRERDEQATIVNFKGLQYTSADSTFYVNFRFRMQSRLKYSTFSGDSLGVDEFEARIRRLRLRMDGYIYDPKLSYSIQLAFTRGDQDFDDTGVANIVRDAVIFYNFTPNFYVSFGQNKLPGNRQRVNSSGQLQFAERSIVNAAMNIDRDFGIKAYYKGRAGNSTYHLKGAVTTGEGRVADKTNDGLAYTGRIEFLPFGDFKNEGDYSEGDLEREETPKLSFGAVYSYNDRTTRTGGQIGEYLYAPVTLTSWMADAIFKYRGWAYQVEYLKRAADNPVTSNEDGEISYAFNGSGMNQQLSCLFGNGYEIAGRYTYLTPGKSIGAFEKQTEVAELGFTKYFRAHRLKLQLNGGYTVKEGKYHPHQTGNSWTGTFQVELGI